MQIFFCEKCNIRLSDADIESGAAVQSGNMVYCRKCAGALNIKATQPAPPKQKTSGRTRALPHPPATSHGTKGQASSNAAYVFLVLGIVAALVILAVFLLKPSRMQHMPPPQPVSEPVAAPWSPKRCPRSP